MCVLLTSLSEFVATLGGDIIVDTHSVAQPRLQTTNKVVATGRLLPEAAQFFYA